MATTVGKCVITKTNRTPDDAPQVAGALLLVQFLQHLTQSLRAQVSRGIGPLALAREFAQLHKGALERQETTCGLALNLADVTKMSNDANRVVMAQSSDYINTLHQTTCREYYTTLMLTKRRQIHCMGNLGPRVLLVPTLHTIAPACPRSNARALTWWSYRSCTEGIFAVAENVIM
eukprot:276246-Pyramimonas_sp.AAC.1